MVFNVLKGLTANFTLMLLINHYDPSPKSLGFCLTVSFLCIALTISEGRS